jgi:hypothetical protein
MHQAIFDDPALGSAQIDAIAVLQRAQVVDDLDPAGSDIRAMKKRHRPGSGLAAEDPFDRDVLAAFDAQATCFQTDVLNGRGVACEGKAARVQGAVTRDAHMIGVLNVDERADAGLAGLGRILGVILRAVAAAQGRTLVEMQMRVAGNADAGGDVGARGQMHDAVIGQCTRVIQRALQGFSDIGVARSGAREGDAFLVVKLQIRRISEDEQPRVVERDHEILRRWQREAQPANALGDGQIAAARTENRAFSLRWETDLDLGWLRHGEIRVGAVQPITHAMLDNWDFGAADGHLKLGARRRDENTRQQKNKEDALDHASNFEVRFRLIVC